MKLVSFDTETHLKQPGIAAPPLVLGSAATLKPGSERIFKKAHTRRLFRYLINAAARRKVMLGGANLVYDFGVMAADDPRVVDGIFAALDADAVVSTDILDALHDNATGFFLTDRHTGAPLGKYSLAYSAKIHLGIDLTADKKGENSYRMRYAEFDGKPLSELPEDAIEYPRRDARFTADSLGVQLMLTPSKEHEWIDVGTGGAFIDECKHCKVRLGDNPPPTCEKAPPKERMNVKCVHDEMRAAWFLQLSAIWGMRTDPELVKHVVDDLRKRHEESRRHFMAEGIVKVRRCSWKKDKDGNKTREKADNITVEDLLRASELIRDRKEEWVPGRLVEFQKMIAKIREGDLVRFAEDKGRLQELVTEAYQGAPPLTDGGESGDRKPSTSRATLLESGNEMLVEYGEAGVDEKQFTSFSTVIEQGTRVPINPSPSVMVSSDRTAYSNPNLQQLPRGGLIRQCFVPRNFRDLDPAQRFLYCSTDYSALELCTGAQVCYWAFGYSHMREAINAGQDLHVRLGARFLGISYEEGKRRKDARDKQMLNIRQAAKPVNFGLGGLMGAPKLVATAHKDGVKFCELLGMSEKCGSHGKTVEHTTESGYSYPIAPTCIDCLAFAVKARNAWYEEWPEWGEYHELTPELAAKCEDGIPIESCGNGMLRLDTNPGAISNHFFQNLAAQGAKRAGYKITKEAYTDRRSILFNNLRIAVFVHDEMFTELRELVATECAWRQAQIQIAEMQAYTPDVQISVEPALCRRWFKGADKEVSKKTGLLRPWWPVDKDCKAAWPAHAKEDCSCWKWAPDQQIMALDLAA